MRRYEGPGPGVPEKKATQFIFTVSKHEILSKSRPDEPWQGTRKQKPRLFFETEKQRFLFVFVEAAEGKQEGLWEGSGHSGQGAVGGHAGTRHE